MPAQLKHCAISYKRPDFCFCDRYKKDDDRHLLVAIYVEGFDRLGATPKILRLSILTRKMSNSTEHPINSKDWYKAYPSPSERSHLPLPQLTPAELQRRTKGRIPGQHYVISMSEGGL